MLDGNLNEVVDKQMKIFLQRNHGFTTKRGYENFKDFKLTEMVNKN